MTGHQRRYNPIVLKARELATAQQFGHLVQGSVLCSLKKPESYFEAVWRRQPGVGGPLLINMIHEIDLLRFIFGEVDEVTAITSNRERGFAVEDTAGAILTFRSGGIVTLSVSDAASAPWAWDISADENPGRFPAHAVQSHFFCGSDGAFSLPDLAVWSHPGEKSWTEAMGARPTSVAAGNAYVNQIVHFGEVIDGKTAPRCSALDGARNVAVIDAIKRSSTAGTRLALDPSGLIAEPAH
jgi:predicted dehydrogenase